MPGRAQLSISEPMLRDLLAVRSTEEIEHVHWDHNSRVLVVTIRGQFIIDVAPGAYIPIVDSQ